MTLDREQRRALELLADAGLPGVCKAMLLAHGFKADTMVAGLVHAGLATVAADSVKAAGRTIQVTRVHITDAGRRALVGPAESE